MSQASAEVGLGYLPIGQVESDLTVYSPRKKADNGKLVAPQVATTPRFRSEFLQTIDERGFLDNCSDFDGLDKLLKQQECKKEAVRAYIGFDATADCLHVGSLTQIMLLRWLQNTGHQPIVLIGRGTTRVGDPSGKNKQRPMLEDEKIGENAKPLETLFKKFLDFKGSKGARFADNLEWLNEIKWLDFLREYGKHFSVNRMVKLDSVRTRLEADKPLSFLEFNYMVLQAFDFLQLHRREGCSVQIGGADQWGNILCGVELIRRIDGANSFALTTPLLTTASGEKMGKSADGAIWLSSEKLSSNDFWQFWRNSADQDVGRFLRLFTELPIKEIERLEKLEGEEINEAKKHLATAVTSLCHGAKDGLAEAKRAEDMFANGDLSKAPEHTIASGIQHFLYDILRENGMVQSNSAARKLIRAQGVRLDGEVVADEKAQLLLHPQQSAVISLGKKTHCALVGKEA